MHILIIRLRLIGDVVFTTPAVQALRRRFPDARLTYLVEPSAEPVVRAHPALDEIIVVPAERGPARIGADLALARRLRRSRIDLAIDFHGGPRSSFLAWASGASARIGYAVAGRGWMYTVRVPRPRELRRRHSVENQWDLLAPLGIAPPDPAHDPVTMAPDPPAVARVEGRLAALGAGPGTGIVVLHVSAGNPFRRWPQAAFAEVASTLARADTRRRIIITSGPSDLRAAGRVVDAARTAAGAAGARILDVQDFDLAELRALVERAALYIGGDSGPMHIAATTRVPIVALLGPTPAERSMPWRSPAWPAAAIEVSGLPCRPCDQRSCAPGDFRCLTRITPAEVVEAAERLLRAAAADGQPDAGDVAGAGERRLEKDA